MFPNIFDCPIDLGAFDNLTGVIDAVYNPIRTPLILSAKKRGISAEGGLYMLVAQAVRASEIFLGTKYESSVTEKVYRRILGEKENTVLIGMPASGKSTVGKILSERYGREFFDTDALIEERVQKSIPDIFREKGEDYFRELEAEIIKEISLKNGAVISTGGGAVLREENISALRENGKIYFIDRPLSALMPTEDRPLASSKEAIEKRYKERYPIYTASADYTVSADCNAECVANKIQKGAF
jgi:shikimate dehydrogenase